MDPWDDDIDGLDEELDDLGGGFGFEDLIGDVLSFFVFASVVSWIGEKLKDLFRRSEK
jgi:hypothetical protein